MMMSSLIMMMRIGVMDYIGLQKSIRIVVVGEQGTGKSTLIKAASEGCFYPNVPRLLRSTRLLPGYFSDRVPAIIVDTSSRVEDKGEVVNEVKQADAIVLTFAFDRPETLDHLSEYLLPLIQQLEVKVPIIVAGCKADINVDYSQTSIKEKISSIMQQCQEVETCLDWSGQTLEHVPSLAREVFMYAYEAVIHPAGPIIDLKTSSLKPRCVAALKRIYLLCCHKTDGVLKEAELNYIQVKCFNNPLMPHQCKELINAVQVRCPLGVLDKGITGDGFLFLNKYLVEGGRIKKVWTILRKFGYNNDLRLKDDCIPYSSFKREPDQSVELTNVAIGYLRDLYQIFDHDSDNNLEPQEMKYIFQTAPDIPWLEAPYEDAAVVTRHGGFSLQAFLSLWAMMTLIDPAKALEYLVYVRFPYDLSSAIRVTRKRSLDRKEQKSDRKVVQCYVFGPKKAGKSALLNRFLGRPYSDVTIDGTGERYAVRMIKESRVSLHNMKTLAMKEIQLQEDGFFLSNGELAACNVAVFLYDSSDESSWKKAIGMLAEVATVSKDAGFEFPCLMVAGKTDLDSFPMAIQVSTKFTQDLGIGAPIPISSKLGKFSNIFRKILTAAEQPHLCIPEIESKKSKSGKLINNSAMVVSIGTAVSIVGLASFRLYAARKQSY